MDAQETKEVLGEIKMIYPARFRKMCYEESMKLLQLWQKCFRDVPKEAVDAALERYMKEDESGFAPEIGQLMRLIKVNKEEEARRQSQIWMNNYAMAQWRRIAEQEHDEEALAWLDEHDREVAEYERRTRNGGQVAVAVCDVCEPAGGGAGAGG